MLLFCVYGADETAEVKTMRHRRLLKIASFVFALVLVAALAWLTMPPDEDPCASPRSDVGAAVLADSAGDQDALVNRAIMVRANCEEENDRAQ